MRTSRPVGSGPGGPGSAACEKGFPPSACRSPGEDSLEIILEKKVRVTDGIKIIQIRQVLTFFKFTYFL